MEKKKHRGDEDLHLLLHKEGLLVQILARLPVVSLLRCKSFCKSWRDLIQSSHFIDLHTTTTFNSSCSSSSSSKFGSFILHAGFFFDTIDSQQTLFMISFEEEESSVSRSGGRVSPWWTSTDYLHGACFEYDDGDACFDDDDDDDDDQLKLDYLGFPSCYEFQNFDKLIAGSCNGLVCLQDRETLPYDFSLWNPATGEFRILPKSITITARNINLVAFGFDVATKDYKVLLLTALKPRWNGHGPTDCFCRVEVYSLSTDSWRLLEGIPCLPGYPFDDADSLYLNGSCFFLAHFFYTEHPPLLPVNDRFIISFDFTKEIITPIQLPDHDRNQELCLCYLGDKIALFTSPKYFVYDTRIRPSYEDFNIWVLNYEHSSSSVNKESWTKLHSFRIQLNKPDISYIPRGISNDGMYALLESSRRAGLVMKMNLYNLVTNELKKKNFLCCSKVMSKAYAYKPSLVSVTGGNGGAAAAADRMIGDGATNL